MCSNNYAEAQTIRGKVVNAEQNPVYGATVYWVGTGISAETDTVGIFVINGTGVLDKRLVARYLGYRPDTIMIQSIDNVQFSLLSDAEIEGITITGRKNGIIVSDILPAKTEQITRTELEKAACCDLAGCFETQTTVQPQVTNVVTQSRELRILGLSGVYNQILIDGLPMIQGLTYTYGISSIPGHLVENIYVAKGANSVLQGFESISGQINVITKKPIEGDQLFLNMYMNSFAEKHMNVSYSTHLGQWKNITAAHIVLPAGRIDRDDDDFLDLPLLTRYLFYNKWEYGNEEETGLYSQMGIRYLHESRIGGQTGFIPSVHQGDYNVYGQKVQINQPEVWTKTAMRWSNNHRIAFMASSYLSMQSSFFGTLSYEARQQNVYANLQHEWNYNAHQLIYGMSFRYMNLEENIQFVRPLPSRTYEGEYVRKEVIPGFFIEHNASFLDNRVTWIAGIRADRHNEFGTFITPRTLLKVDIAPRSIFRASYGLGWRTVQLFSENINLLASSRDVIFEENLKPEQAINFGVNYTQKFDTGNDDVSGYLSADYYRTSFTNQVFPDYDRDPTKAFIHNFNGSSVSHAFQLEMMVKFFQQIELKTGYSYLDVYRLIEGQKVLLPFNSRHKILQTFNFTPISRKYQIDMNMHWFGRQRLPDTRLNPVQYQRPDFSEPFGLMNAQFTYRLKKLELYAGCENIFNFRQWQPIIGWDNPFGSFFDTSSVWGPTRGREAYMGFRWTLQRP